jgi:hypothetical protein
VSNARLALPPTAGYRIARLDVAQLMRDHQGECILAGHAPIQAAVDDQMAAEGGKGVWNIGRGQVYAHLHALWQIHVHRHARGQRLQLREDVRIAGIGRCIVEAGQTDYMIADPGGFRGNRHPSRQPTAREIEQRRQSQHADAEPGQ